MSCKDGIMGLIVGDALGVPFEFKPRKYFEENPVTDLEGYGVHNQPVGTWSDDGSLTLATLDSLTKDLDYEHMMDNFLYWYSDCEFTATDTVFDIGIGTRQALIKFKNGEIALLCGGTSTHNNGNGSLMRILPVAYYINDLNLNMEEWIPIVHNISSLTHRHPRSHIACGIYINITLKILNNPGYPIKDVIKSGIIEIIDYYNNDPEYKEEFNEHFQRIINNEIYNLDKDEITSTGYVIATLESTIWCLTNTKSYKEAVLKAVNLGHDTDTTAAVVGGLAGIYYGYENIPEEWVEQVQKKDYILDLCKKFDKRDDKK